MKRMIAAMLMATHVIVAGAALAERADSTIAAAHVEQAGTSAHHAHGELCALYATSHLIAPPSRAAALSAYASIVAPRPFEHEIPSSAADRLGTRSRAPPV